MSAPIHRGSALERFAPLHMPLLVILLVLGIGMLLTWWKAQRADHEMREDLLQRARLVAQAVSTDQIKALAGSTADLDSRDYQLLKQQLSSIRQANTKCRFAYLLGRKVEGAVFFFVDSEPPGSESYSPPGQAYEELTEGCLRVFDTGTSVVEGPVIDRWGTWISSLVPITDPQTGAVTAVLGMDIDARIWKWDVAAKGGLPVVVTLFLLIALAGIFFAVRRTTPAFKTAKTDLEQRQALGQTTPRWVGPKSYGLGFALLWTLAVAGLLWIAAEAAGKETQNLAIAEARGIYQKYLFLLEPEYMTEESHRMRSSGTGVHTHSLGRKLCSQENPMDSLETNALQAIKTGAGEASSVETVGGKRILRYMSPIMMREQCLMCHENLGYKSGDMCSMASVSVPLEPYIAQTRLNILSLTKKFLVLYFLGLVGLGIALRNIGKQVAQNEQTKEALRASEQSYRNQFANNSVVMLLVDPSDGAIIEANAAALSFYGYPRERLLAMLITDINTLPPSEILEAMASVSQGPGKRFEFQHRLSDGSVREVEVSSSRIQFGGRVVLHSIIHDITERKQAEEALRESESNFRTFFETMSDMIVVGTPDGQILFTNNAVTRALGYGADELAAMHILDMHPSNKRREAEEIFSAMFRGERESCPLPLARKDGGLVPVDTRVWFGRWNGADCIFGISKDLSAEQEAQQRFERLFRNNPTLMALSVLPERTFIDVNDAFLTALGYSREEVIGRSSADLGFFADPDQHAVVTERLRTSGRIMECELLVRRKDGAILNGLFSGEMINSQGKQYFLTVMIDITARKRAEEALRSSETRIRVITDSAQDAIMMMDPEGRISYWNPAAERILGYTNDEAIGVDLHTLIVPQRYHKAHQAAFPGFQQTGHGAALGKTLDLDARRKDGGEISVQLSLSAIQINGGWHAVGILRDITARKQAEAELLAMNLELERQTCIATELASRAEMANAAKSEFLANMSHEIRTPMNGVIGMTGLLLDTELSAEQRHFAKIVHTSAESLLALINDILDFSKIEAKKLELEVLDFDLTSLLDDFAETMAVRAHEKGLELLCITTPAVPTLLRGDPGRLRQVLTNLAGNAIKFTGQGEVIVRVQLELETVDDVLLRFAVCDTGIGIPEDKLGRLFDKFTQADASTTRQYGGTGLGLAISKQLAEIMGGKIGVNSEVGKGSEFWFTVRLGRQAEGSEVNAPPPADLNNVRVLVVDDNATSREILITRMDSWGMRPAAVEGGSEAIEELHKALDAKDPFRIAVIDMQMPGMDGETLGRILRGDTRLARTRLVMLTSLAMRGDARRFEEIGFVAYLTKPVRHHELKAVLSMALAGECVDQLQPQSIVTRHLAREQKRMFAGGKTRILLAEDNITNQQVALGILKKLGLRADAVANGAEALRALETLPYDLVLMDIQMPEMDGFAATRIIRDPQSAVQNHQIPIVAMTANAMQGDRERCLEADMDDYVSKPVTPQALSKVLGKWLRETENEAKGMPEEEKTDSSADPELSSLPVWDKRSMMERLMDDEELVDAILKGFLSDMPQQILALKAFLEAGAGPDAERQAHTIKGAAANVSGEFLRAVASEMENLARAGGLSAATARMTKLEAAFEQLKGAMSKEA